MVASEWSEVLYLYPGLSPTRSEVPSITTTNQELNQCNMDSSKWWKHRGEGTAGNPISITQYELLIMDTSSGASWNIYTEVELAYIVQFLQPVLLYHFKVRGTKYYSLFH